MIKLVSTENSSYEDSYFAVFEDEEYGKLRVLVEYDDVPNENNASALETYVKKEILTHKTVKLDDVSAELRELVESLMDTDNDMIYHDCYDREEIEEYLESDRAAIAELERLFPKNHPIWSAIEECVTEDFDTYTDDELADMDWMLCLYTSFQSYFWF